MTFQVALTSPELTIIRGKSGSAEYAVTFCQNTVILHGQNNSDLTTPTSWTEFEYTGISGDWTDVEPFMVLLMGVDNDIYKATFRGRIRPDLSEDQGITAGTIFCNQSSDDFVNSAYFWVINTYDLTNRLSAASSQDPDTALELLDYDLPGGQLPATKGLQTAYVGDADPISGKLRIHIDISASRQTDDRATSTLTQTWIIADATYIVGSNTANIITVDVLPGEQWATLLLEDSLGQIRRRKFYINVHDDSNPPFTDTDSIRISGNINNGWTATVNAFNGLDNMLTRSFGVIWRRTTAIRSNVAFVGWVQPESSSVRGSAGGEVDGTTQLSLMGVNSRLGRIESQETPMYDVVSPVKNGDIVTLTPQRAQLYYLDWYTTAGLLCDINLEPFNNDFNFPIIPTTGNVAVEAMNSIAKQWNAIVEYAPWGAICIARTATFLSTAQRAALPTIIAYTEQDIVLPNGISRDIDPAPNTGKTDANGAIYILSTKTVTDWQTRSPGHAQGEASGSNVLANQILTASNNALDGLTELRQRGADFYEESNLQDVMTVSHPDIYDFIIPTKTELYTFDLDTLVPSGRGMNRIVITPDILWTVDDIGYTIKPGGQVDVEAKYRRVCRKGDPGDDVTLQPPNSDIPAVVDPGPSAFDFEPLDVSIPDEGFDIGDISPDSLTPQDGGILFLDGDELIVWSSTANRAFLVKNYVRLTTPNVVDITPDNLAAFTIRQLVADPGAVTKYGVGCYLLADDGTNSAVWYNPNIATLGAMAGWAKGDDAVGLYTVIRGTGTPGSIMICAPDISNSSPGSWPITLDFTTSDGGFQRDYPGMAWGSWTSGVGWHSDVVGGGDTRQVGGWSRRIPPTYISSITIHHIDPDPAVGGTRSLDTYKNSTGATIYGGGFSGTFAGGLSLNHGNGSFTEVVTVNDTIDFITIVLTTNFNLVGQNVNDYLIFNGTGSDPFIDDAVIIQYSSDYGGTWGGEITVGDAPAGGAVGFDTQRSGSVSYAGYSGGVAKATTLGGSYSPWFTVPSGDPICVIQPYFRRNGTTLNTALSDPDVLVATTTGKLYWVDGTAATSTDITPTGVTAFDSPNCVTVHYTHIACYGSVSGTLHLFISKDAGATWTDVGAVSGAKFVRCRRKDTTGSASGSNRGQLYLIRGNGYYSSKWGTNGIFIRNLPVSMTGLETVW